MKTTHFRGTKTFAPVFTKSFNITARRINLYFISNKCQNCLSKVVCIVRICTLLFFQTPCAAAITPNCVLLYLGIKLMFARDLVLVLFVACRVELDVRNEMRVKCLELFQKNFLEKLFWTWFRNWTFFKYFAFVLLSSGEWSAFSFQMLKQLYNTYLPTYILVGWSFGYKFVIL